MLFNMFWYNVHHFQNIIKNASYFGFSFSLLNYVFNVVGLFVFFGDLVVSVINVWQLVYNLNCEIKRVIRLLRSFTFPM